MAFSDPHDPRKFLRYAKCDESGAIVAMIEVAETAPPPMDASESLFVDISEHGAIDLADPILVESVAPLVEAHLAAVAAAKVQPAPVLEPSVLEPPAIEPATVDNGG